MLVSAIIKITVMNIISEEKLPSVTPRKILRHAQSQEST